MKPAKHLESIKPSYIREILNLSSSKDIISLAGGLPCPEAFPLDLITQLMPTIAADSSLYQYAQTTGHPALLEHLKNHYSLTATQELMITNGSQQGIDLCARLLIEKGDKIVVEAPSYLGALQVFSIAQAQVCSVPQTIDGPNLDYLETLFANNTIKFFYAVPDFHNPTGCCWSLEKRKHVAKLCQDYGVLLIEDAPYRELRFSGKTLPMVSSFCSEHAIILRSFSKTLAPGVRLAALITPKRYTPLLNKLKQAMDLHSNMPMQALVLALLQHKDFERHQMKLIGIYKERYQTLATKLLPLQHKACDFTAVEGGMFIWLRLPECDTFALAKAAIKKGVAVVPSTEFYTEQTTQESAIRLNFSFNEPSILTLAVSKLIGVIKTSEQVMHNF